MFCKVSVFFYIKHQLLNKDTFPLHRQEGLLPPLLSALHAKGILTDDLTVPGELKYKIQNTLPTTSQCQGKGEAIKRSTWELQGNG